MAGVRREVLLNVAGTVTLHAVLDVLETTYPALAGTLRDHASGQRRPFIRFFALEDDLSHLAPDAPLPEAVATGREPLLIVGAVAGGSAGHAALPVPATREPTPRLARPACSRER
jgi:hypothetical protein